MNLLINLCNEPDEVCCYDKNGKHIGCYKPDSCDRCDIDKGILLRGDQANEILARECKKCTNNNQITDNCTNTQKCCTDGTKPGICYDKVCERCNDQTGEKEDKCTAPQKCCANSDPDNPCYNPKLCEECHNNTIIKGPNACVIANGSSFECCTNYGCYDKNCKQCSSAGISDKCLSNETCVFCGGNWVCASRCEVCRNGQLVDILVASNKDPQCYTCKNKTVVPICTGTMKCCYGVCYDKDCSVCDTQNGSPTFGQVIDDCGPDKICCQCPNSSPTTYDPDKCCHPKKNEKTGCSQRCGPSGSLEDTSNCKSQGKACCDNECYTPDPCTSCIYEKQNWGTYIRDAYYIGIDPQNSGFNDCCIDSTGKKEPFNNQTQKCCGGKVMSQSDDSMCCGNILLKSNEICCNREVLNSQTWGCCNNQKFKTAIEICCQDTTVTRIDNCCNHCNDPKECCGNDCIDLNDPCQSCEIIAYINNNPVYGKVSDFCAFRDPNSFCCQSPNGSAQCGTKGTCDYFDADGLKQACQDALNKQNKTTSCCTGIAGLYPNCFNPECQDCDNHQVVLKPDFVLCNNKCCPTERGCNPTTGECCPKGMIPCGDTCCNPDQCCINQFVPPAPGGYNSSLSQEYNYQTKILSSQCLSPGYFCCNNIAYSKSVYKECCNNTPIGLDQTCCTKSDGSKFVCNSGESCCGDICCSGTCCNNKDCCDVACCSGPYGGCYNSSSCQECTNSIVTDKCLGQQCCDGICYDPYQCKSCVNGIIVPTNIKNSCYCYHGQEICNCPIAGLRIEIDTENTGHCCDAATFKVRLVSTLSGQGSIIGSVNLNNSDSCTPPRRQITVSDNAASDLLNNLIGQDCCNFRLELICDPSGFGAYQPFGPDQCHTSIANGRVFKTLSNGSESLIWSGYLDNTGTFNICDETLLP